MESLIQFSATQAYWILFGAVLLDVLGLPLTAMPLLFIAGGLAASGTMSLPFIVALATIAATFGDILWYAQGRNGSQYLRFLDRLCGARKACLTNSIRFVKTYGIFFLVISKFLPGVASLACPAAGLANMPLPRFLLANVASRALWAASVAWLGYSGTSYTSFF